MVDFTSVMSVQDIEVRGFRQICLFEQGSEMYQKVVMDATIKNKSDIIFKKLDKEGKILQAFQKLKG